LFVFFPSQGFYAVYDELFQRLAKQEAEAREHRDKAADDGRRPPPQAPRFGERQAALGAHLNSLLAPGPAHSAGRLAAFPPR
jgi:hypothetical protein